jgi:anti-sigma regulatory factor (Ser/Thr protein kinase)/ABC-type transporter Mla MlaB component
VCRQIVEILTRIAGFDDDIAVIAAERVRPPEPLELVLAAERAAVSEVRARLGAWLGDLRVGAMDTMSLQHAVGELVTNAVEHAYVDAAAGSVEVRAVLAPGGTVEIDVVDRGRWRTSENGRGRGRGLAMAQGLADELLVERDGDGTRARLRHRPSASPQFLSVSADAAMDRPHVEHGPLEVSVAGPRLTVSGAVDQASASDLRRSIAHITRGGTTEVLVDLTDVSTLASAGVQVLVEQMTRPGASIQLLAPMGSPAQHVLDVVRLPYVTA